MTRHESITLTRLELSRFFSKVTIDAATECWLWAACTASFGYARFQLRGRTDYGHRISHRAFVGPIPPEREIDSPVPRPALREPGAPGSGYAAGEHRTLPMGAENALPYRAPVRRPEPVPNVGRETPLQGMSPLGGAGAKGSACGFLTRCATLARAEFYADPPLRTDAHVEVR